MLLFLESPVTIISVYHHHQTHSEQTLRWQGTELFRFFFQISQLIFQINLTIQPLITKEAVDFDGTRLQSLLAALVTSSVQLLRGVPHTGNWKGAVGWLTRGQYWNIRGFWLIESTLKDEVKAFFSPLEIRSNTDMEIKLAYVSDYGKPPALRVLISG